MWKTDSLVRSLSVILQHSELYQRVDMTQLWYSLNLVLMLNCRDLHILLSIICSSGQVLETWKVLKFYCGIFQKWKVCYSQTSGKRQPKMSNLGGRLWEVVAYESLDLIASKFYLSVWKLQRLTPCFQSFVHVQSQFEKKNLVIPIENWPSFVLSRNAIM